MRKAIKFDTPLALTVLFLLIFGLIMITSIGVPKSISLSAPDVLYPNCSDEAVDCYLLFKKHIFRLGVALAAFAVAFKLPMKFWKKVSPILYVAVAALLVMVFVSGQSFGTIATNWLIFFNTSLQPSELAKLVLVIYLAHWFSKKKSHVESFRDGVIPFGIIAGIIGLPIILQNDFGSALVIATISMAMYFAAGARLKHIGIIFAVMIVGGIIVVSTVPHVAERFAAFSSIDEECLEDYCWQSQQANIAIGSGGFWGKGLTQGVQKSYWLPQASDDFIFAASAEELGFLRVMFVVLAYFVIALRGYRIADKAGSSFEMLLAVGITTWIVFQAFINIGVNTALLPVTGITLPFVSYGGSSLLASLVGIAILLNISERTGYYSSGGRVQRRSRTNTRVSRYRRS